MASPAIQARRPGSIPDPYRPGEYTILRGSSLKQASSATRGLVSLRYNFQPMTGPGTQRSIITEDRSQPGSAYKLVVEGQDPRNATYSYRGRDESGEMDENGLNSTSFALIFDKAKSSFLLEPISSSLDFNLVSGSGQSEEEVRLHNKIPTESTQRTSSKSTQLQPVASPNDNDSDTPDQSNPFDYRHFLIQAREKAEQANATGSVRTPVPGGSTPTPGNGTPKSGISSPIPGTGRFQSNELGTPQPRTTTTSPAQKKRKIETESKNRPKHGFPSPRSHPSSVKPSQKRDPATAQNKSKRNTPKSSSSSHNPNRNKPLSKARITDSDSSDADAEGEDEEYNKGENDMSDTIVVDRSTHQASKRPQKGNPEHTQRPSSSSANGHMRHSSNTSITQSRSPHILVTDAPSGLEIDMGSPPASARNRRFDHVNPGAFRSRTGTPQLGALRTPHAYSGRFADTTNASPSDSARSGPDHDENNNNTDVDMELDDHDVTETNHDDNDDDNDVEALSLGSPRTRTITSQDNSNSHSRSHSRIHSHGPGDHHRHHYHNNDSIDDDEDDDDDDALAAELARALEEEDQHDQNKHDESTNVGLGISAGMIRHQFGRDNNNGNMDMDMDMGDHDGNHDDPNEDESEVSEAE